VRKGVGGVFRNVLCQSEKTTLKKGEAGKVEELLFVDLLKETDITYHKKDLSKKKGGAESPRLRKPLVAFRR